MHNARVEKCVVFGLSVAKQWQIHAGAQLRRLKKSLVRLYSFLHKSRKVINAPVVMTKEIGNILPINSEGFTKFIQQISLLQSVLPQISLSLLVINL